jgi:hypothetical protein
LPDGRIFGQITQNRPQKYFLAGKYWKMADFFQKLQTFGTEVAEKLWKDLATVDSSKLTLIKGGSMYLISGKYAMCSCLTVQASSQQFAMGNIPAIL